MNSDRSEKTADNSPDPVQDTKQGVSTWKVVVGLSILLPFVAVQWLLHSTFTLNFAAEKAEQALAGLELKNISGSLSDGVRLDGEYQIENNLYSISGLQIKLVLKCLWRLQVCVEALQVDEINIAIQSSEPQPKQQARTEAITLPSIQVPVDISVDALTIGRVNLVVDDQAIYSIADISTHFSLRTSQVYLPSFSAVDEFCHWQLTSELTLDGDYPLNTQLNCESQQGLGSFTATFSNTVKNLELDAILNAEHPLIESGGDISIELAIQALEPTLPLSGNAKLQSTTVLNLSTALANQSTTDKLSLAAANIAFDSLNLNAAVTIDSEFSHSRWPGDHIITSTAEINSGDKTAQIKNLDWTLPKGQLNVAGEFSWDKGLHWTGPVAWQNLNLEYWQQWLHGSLSGTVQTALHYVEQNLSADAVIDLEGNVNQQAITGSGHLSLNDKNLSIDQLLLASSKGRVFVNGNAGLETLDLVSEFNIPEINRWLQLASGSVVSELRFQGALSNPTIQGFIKANNVQYQSINAKAINTTINWLALESQQNQITVEATNVEQNQNLANATFNWQGGLAQHDWHLNANGLEANEDKSLTIHCSGSWSAPVIKSYCDQAELNFNYFDKTEQWRLSSAIDFALNTQLQDLSLSAFCFSNGDQSICNNKNIKLTPQSTEIATIKASNLSAEWIQPWLPQNAQLEGTWNAALSLDDPFNQPVVSANLDSNTLALQIRQKDQPPIGLTITSLEADWVWQQSNQQHQVFWQFATQNNGSSRGNITLQGEKINGQLSLRQWQLAAFSKLILQQPRDRVEGLVNASFKLSGDINKPLLNGNMSIDKGNVKTSALPVPIEEIDIDLNVADNNATLTGAFIANQSPGSLGGTMYWSPQDWHADLSLKAKDLAIQPDNNIQVFVSPDINLVLSPKKVAVNGTVQVPKAQVEIETLPEQAVTVSRDTIIEGSGATETVQQQVSTNLNLILGDQVSFTGFGLETQITGNLNIQQKPGEILKSQGVLQLKDGRYNSYGQDLIIRNGDLVFVSDIDNPQLRLEAIREPLKTADDVIVGLRVSGAARNPKVALFSEPPLGQQAQLSYMISGTAPGTDTETDPTQLAAQSALSYALSSSAGEGLTEFAGKALGIEDLKVSTNSNENGTQIGLSGYVTPKLLVRYGVGVFDSVNSLTLKYQLKKNLYLKAVSGESNALDILWSFEKD